MSNKIVLNKLAVGDNLDYCKIIVDAKSLAISLFDSLFSVGDAGVVITCENGSINIYSDKNNDTSNCLHIELNSSDLTNTYDLVEVTTWPSKYVVLLPTFLGKVTNISWTGNTSDVNCLKKYIKIIANRTFYGIFKGAYQFIKKQNDRLDYYMSLASEYVDCNSQFVAGDISGITESDSHCWMIGNYIHLYASLSLTSAAQTSVGTGNVDNVVVARIKIPNIYYPDYSELTNAERKTKIRGYNGGSIAVGSGGSSGSAHVIACFISSFVVSDHDITIPISVSAVKAKSSNWVLRVLIPIERCKCVEEDE